MLFLMFTASQHAVCMGWVAVVVMVRILVPILQMRQLRQRGDSLCDVTWYVGGSAEI